MARLHDDATTRRLARIPRRVREVPALRTALREVADLRERATRARHDAHVARQEGERQETARLAAMAVAARGGGEDGSPEAAEAEAARDAARAREEAARDRAAALESAAERAEDDTIKMLDSRASGWAEDARRQREPLVRAAHEAVRAAEEAVATLAALDAGRRFLEDWPDVTSGAKGAYASDATIPALTTREGFPLPASSAFAALRSGIADEPLRPRSRPRRVADLVRPLRGSRTGTSP